MWIKCNDNELLNTEHIRRLVIGEASQVMPTEHTNGTKIVRGGFPKDGWLLVAFTHCPSCIARYKTSQEAEAALRGLYEAINAGAKTFELP
jgi:hypothetical protein